MPRPRPRRPATRSGRRPASTDEEQHCGQGVPRAQLEPQVLVSERGHVGEVGAHARSRARRRGASGSRRAGSCVATTRARAPCERGELCVEERCAILVEGGVWLVEHEQLRVVEERAAEGEPLGHAARVRADALAASVPQPEPLEQHPDALAPLGNAVEAPEEVEVLERRELAVEDRLVADVADTPAVERHFEHPACRGGEADEHPQQVVFPSRSGPVTTRCRARHLEGERAGTRSRPVALPSAAARIRSRLTHRARFRRGAPSTTTTQGHPRRPDATLSPTLCRMGAVIVPEVSRRRRDDAPPPTSSQSCAWAHGPARRHPTRPPGPPPRTVARPPAVRIGGLPRRCPPS